MRLLALLLAPAVLGAQPVAQLGPLTARRSSPQPAANRPVSFEKRLPAPPEFHLAPLSRAEMDRVPSHPGRPLKGYERAIDARIRDRGEWQTVGDGRTFWRISIRAEGAYGMRLRFSEFAVGAGEVWIYGSGGVPLGPYSARGPNGSGEFWSNTIFDGSLTVEYEPAGASPEGSSAVVPFAITRVAQMIAPVGTMAASSCELDVSCYPAWSTLASGVAMYIFQSDGASYACSGALVNNTAQDATPYFLTAGHCVADADSAASVEVFWNYQTPGCNGLPPDLASVPRTLGASYLTSGTIENGDFSLILLNPLPDIPLHFFGWNSSPDAVPMGTSLTGIHHPQADYARIAFGTRAPDTAILVGSDLAQAATYYQVQESSGRIEPGSSGSPLFTSDQLLVGTLSYGPTTPACSTSPFQAGYGRFALAYGALAQYLSPASSSTAAAPPAITLSPASITVPYTIGAAAPAPQTVQVSATGAAALTLTVSTSAPWIGLSASNVQIVPGQPATFAFWLAAPLPAVPGASSGTITVAGGGVTQTIAVTVNAAAGSSSAPAAVGPMSLIPLFQDGGGFATTFVLLNPYNTPSNASIAFATPGGSPIEVALAGQAGSSWQSVTIPAFGSITLVSSDTASVVRSGVAMVQSSDPAKKIQPYALVNQDVVTAAASYNLPLALPFDATASGATTLYLYNPAASGLLSLTLTVYDTTGAAIGAGSLAIPAGQESVLTMSKDAAVFGGKAGTLYVWGSGTVLAMGVRTASDGRLSMVTPW